MYPLSIDEQMDNKNVVQVKCNIKHVLKKEIMKFAGKCHPKCCNRYIK